MEPPIWLLTTEELRHLLTEAASGSDVDDLLIEAYANATHDDGSAE